MTYSEPLLQTENLEIYQEAIQTNLNKISEQNIINRIWKKDYTVWKDVDKEISNRLGWLASPYDMVETLQEIKTFVQSIQTDGYTHALLLGMGGSSLAPEVLAHVFGTHRGYLDLAILDSTDPGAILTFKHKLGPQKTLFIVSSKSGTTVETLSLFKFFFNWLYESLGEKEAGAHFIAITDPGSPLERLASKHHFRSLFLGNPKIGGRFSALSTFNLVPGALIGTKIPVLLERSQEIAQLCRQSLSPQNNPGCFLGTVLATLAQFGRDKATFILSPKIESFAFWLEQLLAESTGKEGEGILPIVGEPVSLPDAYGSNRLFIHICLKGDKTHEEKTTLLKRAKHPYLRISFPDLYSLGSQFFLWEMATSIAGFLLGINPFDQPNVVRSKKKAQELIRTFKNKRNFPIERPVLSEKNLSLFAVNASSSIKKSLKDFLIQAKPGDYIAIQAFLQPIPETSQLLQSFRIHLRNHTKLAVTAGFGPRYLHSTGQLHKGDRGNGLFIHLTADDFEDIPIPDEAGSPRSSLSFGMLKSAQARGDLEALKEEGRRAIHLHLDNDVVGGLKKIISYL